MSNARLQTSFLKLVIYGFLILVIAFSTSYYTPKPTITPDKSHVVINDITYAPDLPKTTPNRTQIGQEKACIYMLVRNEELHGALESIRILEDRFNRRYRYPWVFLNDNEFTPEFKTLTSGMVSGESHFGFIEPEDWNPPQHLNQTHYELCLQEFVNNDVIYGGSKSYRNMCRYNSGKFFWHPLMMQYDFYWRVEPGIQLFCDQLYDPFEFLRVNNKVYGFVITFTELKETIPHLYSNFTQFVNENPELLAKDNLLNFVNDFTPIQPWRKDEIKTNLDGYNLCHFWSNFEIADMRFFRSKEYTKYFEFLDESNGFYYERWGDAPVHTLGVISLANKTQIHHFSDIGYYHPPMYRCPHDFASFASGRCLCPVSIENNVEFMEWNCLPLFYKHAGKQLLFNNVKN